jgi:diguanylate cyclase (GGDEF)-like protein
MGSSLALLMIDIDFFKNYNDIHGHQEGDNCLIRIAKILENNARRAGDLAARYGGEEFAVILPNTRIEHAVIVAKNILSELNAEAIPHGGSSVSDRVTASIGVAAVIPFVDLNLSVSQAAASLIHLADSALYTAKNQGRNQWVIK